MPLIGSDLTTRQKRILRASADIVNPGMSDAAVLAWATKEGAQAATDAAAALARTKVLEQTNQARDEALAGLNEALTPEPDEEPAE